VDSAISAKIFSSGFRSNPACEPECGGLKGVSRGSREKRVIKQGFRPSACLNWITETVGLSIWCSETQTVSVVVNACGRAYNKRDQPAQIGCVPAMRCALQVARVCRRLRIYKGRQVLTIPLVPNFHFLGRGE